MRKFLPYILILTILVQLLAPFSLGGGVKINKAEAIDAENGIILTSTPSGTDKSITVNTEVIFTTGVFPGDTKEGVRVIITEPDGTRKFQEVTATTVTENDQGQAVFKGGAFFNNLKPDTTYQITTEARQLNTLSLTWDGLQWNFLDIWDEKNSKEVPGTIYVVKIDASVKTNPFGVTITNNGEAQTVMNDTALLPLCVFGNLDTGTFSGCIAQMFYYVLFIPTSYVFALAGTFFDFTFHYSIQDESYRTPFVVEGWGIVRDFCNMFFIFILLYIAFGTILHLHSVKTKEMIINVIIIGLLINFSLFATQVIIDASNILARVFYNSDSIKITQGTNAANGVTNVTPGLKIGPNGEIPLSAAIVNKVNPQNLIINGTKAVVIKDKVTNTQTTASNDKQGNLGTGAFILITLLAVAVNIVGIIVFLSIGLIFVTRVIGLWFAMIFSPFVFFSYTVPSLQDMEMVGWKKWWPETLKLAFLAPIFIFFMYLIIAFLEKGLSLVKANDVNDGMTFVISVIVPFIFIMVLLMKAKDIAKDMSGKMGQSITNGIAAAGGVALGAATGGAALLGRASIGRISNKMGNSAWLNDAAAGKSGKMAQFFGKGLKNATNYTAKSSFDFRQTKAGNAFTKETGLNLDTGTNFIGLDTKKGLGGYAGAQQRKVEKENKFGETLGYDHHKYEEIGDEISEKEKALADYKASGVDHNTTEYKQSVASQENAINKKKKEQERVKSGRAKEYALTMKRKSGKIYDVDMTEKYVERKKDEWENEKNEDKKEKKKIEYEHAKHAYEHKDDYRDDNGNIKKFGHANSDGARAAKQIMKEFAKGMAQGAITGTVAGSVIPGVGTLAGAGMGTLIGGVRSVLINYSGTTNRKTGEESHGDKHETKNNYNPGKSNSAPKTDSHTTPSGGDAHGEPKH